MARLGPGDIAPSRHTNASDSHADDVSPNALLPWKELSAAALVVNLHEIVLRLLYQTLTLSSLFALYSYCASSPMAR